MSWQPFVEVEGKWYTNSCVFKTKLEAEKYARNLFNRWFTATGHKAEKCDLPVNYIWDDTVGACSIDVGEYDEVEEECLQ